MRAETPPAIPCWASRSSRNWEIDSSVQVGEEEGARGNSATGIPVASQATILVKQVVLVFEEYFLLDSLKF